MKRFIPGAASLLLFLVCWEALSRWGFVHISLFPPPSRVVAALIEMARSGELLRDLRVSLWRAVLGWGFGSVVGVAVGLMTGRMKAVRVVVAPIILLFRPLPPVAIIPLIIVWFGIGETSKVFSIAFAVFFSVWINAHLGSQTIPNSFVWSARTLKVGRFELLWRVILPAALPFIVAGLRSGIAMAFIMVFVSELAGASSGVGYQISISQLAYRVDRMMASLAVLALLGATADAGLTVVLTRMFPWLSYSSQK
jgi:ABC-type nitrate/sulfonate/bicarbonate transport system permease component